MIYNFLNGCGSECFVNFLFFYLHHLYKHHAYEEMEASDNFLVGIVFDLALVCRIDFDLEHEVH